MAAVLKPFLTAVQCFAAGDAVSPRDDLAPHRFEDLVEGGFIEPLPRSNSEIAATVAVAEAPDASLDATGEPDAAPDDASTAGKRRR